MDVAIFDFISRTLSLRAFKKGSLASTARLPASVASAASLEARFGT